MVISRTTQKMKFSIKDFFSKCDQIRRILNGKLHFLCSGVNYIHKKVHHGCLPSSLIRSECAGLTLVIANSPADVRGCLIVFVIANVWKSDINQSRMNHFRVSFHTATNSDKVFTQPFEI